MYPNCIFTMSGDEEGMGFMGAAKIINGEVLSSIELTDSDYPCFNGDFDNQDEYDRHTQHLYDVRAELVESL
jgi:hypothetical protein